MSGVAKDDTSGDNSNSETVSTAVDTAAVETVAKDAESEAKAASEKTGSNRKPAPHLRVVADNESALPASSSIPSIETPPAQRMGAVIRQARLDRGYDLEQVSKETRITVSHLRAIEEMTPNLIGEPVYVKGHVRTYARHLGLDADMVLERYLKECALLSDPRKVDIAPPTGGRKLPVAVPVLGILIVGLAIAGGAFVVLGSNNNPIGAPAPQTSSAVAGIPAAVVVEQASPAASAPILQIRALRRARLEVRGANGDSYRGRYFSPGETYAPRVGAGWTVTTPDGAAFEWVLGDKSLGLLAVEGPVYAQSVDLALKREPVAGDTPDPASPSPSGAPELDANAPTVVAAPGAPATKPSPAASASVSATPPKPRPRPSASAANPPADPPKPAASPSTDPALAAYQ